MRRAKSGIRTYADGVARSLPVTSRSLMLGQHCVVYINLDLIDLSTDSVALKSDFMFDLQLH